MRQVKETQSEIKKEIEGKEIQIHAGQCVNFLLRRKKLTAMGFCLIEPDKPPPSKLSTFQQSTTETINKFGGRIGKLEAHNEVQDEQMRL